jgi:histidine ammonia-lyase
VARLAGRDEPVYGVNTGFGLLARKRISRGDLGELQRRLVLSHAVGTGPLLPDDVVRLVLVLKIASLARGHSGVRRTVIDALVRLLNAEVYPCIPAKGSVGASGDLAPLAHLSAVLLGTGAARVGGRILPARTALARARLAPLALAAKEGLARPRWRWPACSPPRTCSRRRSWQARCRATPCWPATCRSTRASRRCAASPGRPRSPGC